MIDRMANQSRISVPASITGAERICLQAIIEQLDIATGNRGGDAYIAKSELAGLQTELNSGIETTVAALQEEVEALTEALALASSDTELALDRELELYWLKGWDLKFIGRATNGPVTFTSDYNVAAGERLSVGLYEFTLGSADMFGTTILDSVSPALAGEYSSVRFSQAFSRPGTAGLFRITVRDAAGALLDPVTAGDLVICAGMVSKEGVFP